MKRFLLVLMLLLSSHTMTKEGGNGGGVHYCPDKKSATLYDLYEAENRYELSPNHALELMSPQQMDEFVLKKLIKNNPFMGYQAWKIIQDIDKGKFVFKNNLDLKEIEDANFLMTDKGCTYEQLANWDNITNKIFIDNSLYVLLDTKNKVALRWHEAIYKFFRTFENVDNSDYIRNIVGALFSDEEIKKVFKSDLMKGQDSTFSLSKIKRDPDLGPYETDLKEGWMLLNIPNLSLDKKIKFTLSQTPNLEERVKSNNSNCIEIANGAPDTKAYIPPVYKNLCMGQDLEMNLLDGAKFYITGAAPSASTKYYLIVNDGLSSLRLTLNPTCFEYSETEDDYGDKRTICSKYEYSESVYLQFSGEVSL